MRTKNAKAQPRKHSPKSKPAPNSSVKGRSNPLSKNSAASDNSQATDELDANLICAQGEKLEGESSNRILEESGIIDGTGGDDLSEQSTELTAITLHQPWASLIAQGKKHYETRDWSTDYRGPIAIHAGKKFHKDESLISLLEVPAAEVPLGAVVAIAELTDCILMDEEFILKQSSFEQYLGLWKVGRYAWKLENVRAIEPIPATGKQDLWKWNSEQLDSSNEFKNWLQTDEGKAKAAEFGITIESTLEPWNPADFGELHHVAENDGQLNLLDWTDKEPPDPDDYVGSIELFEEAYKQWEEAQRLTVNSEELCSTLMDGSICVPVLEPVSPTPELNSGKEALTISASGTATADEFLQQDSPELSDSTTSESVTSTSTTPYSSSLLARLANPSQLTETDSQQTIQETASPTYSELSKQHNQNSQLLKTSPDSSLALTPPATNQEATSATSSTPYRQMGTMRNGFVSGATSLPLRGVDKDCLLLRSPGALSTTTGRPPGKTKLESQLQELNLISAQEVVAPEFLEIGYNLPVGWTNPQENRTALELSQIQAQQLPIAHKSELPAETETTAIEEKLSAIAWTGELPLSDSNELNISVTLPPNIGALSKAELIAMADEQHQLICGIERRQFKLSFEKLYRIHVTGLFLMEFKKRCQYGEFVEQLETHGINPRVAQNYMTVSKNWELVEAKAHLSALLAEENNEVPTLGINWALQVIREEKKQLKQEAPPKDPDNYRTPNTSDQPVVSLVKKALGGEIWLDPCSDSGSNIPAAVRYYKKDNGLAQHNTWSKTVFINPPFSDPFPWVERTCLEVARGTVSAAVMLLKAGVVANMGTGELINKYASAICHWKGRINFLNDEGNPVKGADFDCVFLYFGSRLDLFRQAFGGRGIIATIENHYSSVNKKFMTPNEKPVFGNVEEEQKQLAAAVGLGNGRLILPDRRDFDRELMERYDPHTVNVNSMTMPTPATAPTPVSNNLFQPITTPEIFDETPLAVRQYETAKQNTLNDYITAISSNLSDFSDEQISFLAKIINEESVKRIGF